MKCVDAKKRAARSVLRIPALFIFLLAASCATGTGGGTAPGALVDVTGTWEITETITEASELCEPYINETSTWTADAVQIVNNVTVTVTEGENVGTAFEGVVSGFKIDWKGSYPTSDGTTTVTGTDITVYDGTTLRGTANWEWSDGVDSCDGKTEVTGEKI